MCLFSEDRISCQAEMKCVVDFLYPYIYDTVLGQVQQSCKISHVRMTSLQDLLTVLTSEQRTLKDRERRTEINRG